MVLRLDGLERHGVLGLGVTAMAPKVREELLAMSAASIGRYLKTAKAKDPDIGCVDDKTLTTAA